MATPPNFQDLARKQRLAINSRLSFNAVVNGGAPTSQNVAMPMPLPQINYDHLHVSGLSNTVTIGGEPAASEEINGVYSLDAVTSPNYPRYLKYPYIVTPYMDYWLGRATNNYWGLGRFGGQNDNNVCTSTVPTSSILPAGNAAWSVIDVTLSDGISPEDTPVSIHVTGQVSIRYDVIS